jgi:hypothetical protein
MGGIFARMNCIEVVKQQTALLDPDPSEVRKVLGC